ncbi:putative nuclear receptor coactivator 7-like [Triplophysa rosa]|uniref:Nuclear receptor coactivator 7-like n=1 Tax=Triplophysa rosa TaxID=992332 RepID=A0A9W7WR28_TRIRA|nr:putative nuclear receptor coactivator 7-like [Triplophysa rosa]
MGVAYSMGEVDHLYTFFVQWSPEIYYNKHDNEKNAMTVDTDTHVSVIDTLLNNPASKPWKFHMCNDTLPPRPYLFALPFFVKRFQTVLLKAKLKPTSREEALNQSALKQSASRGPDR